MEEYVKLINENKRNLDKLSKIYKEMNLKIFLENCVDHDLKEFVLKVIEKGFTINSTVNSIYLTKKGVDGKIVEINDTLTVSSNNLRLYFNLDRPQKITGKEMIDIYTLCLEYSKKYSKEILKKQQKVYQQIMKQLGISPIFQML